jgi:plastocyanin
MRTLPIALIVITAAAAATPAAAATRTVRVGDNWFVSDGSPRTISVSRGTTVRWRWTGDNPHNVVARGAARFQSSVKRSGTYSRRLRSRGTYRIRCTIHPPDMRMRIRVR